MINRLNTHPLCYFFNRLNIFIWPVILFILLTVSCSEKQSDFKAEVFKQENGYGYNILVKNKIFIKQNTIPAVMGNKVFCDSIDALKVSNMVLLLLEQNKIPTITKDDIEQMQVKLKCNG